MGTFRSYRAPGTSPGRKRVDNQRMIATALDKSERLDCVFLNAGIALSDEFIDK